MSAMTDVLRGLKNVVVMNERVTNLAKQVEQLGKDVNEQDKRLIRVEAFVDLVRPVVRKRLVGPK